MSGPDAGATPPPRGLRPADVRAFGYRAAVVSVSSAMVGACLTGIGLVRVVEQVTGVDSPADAALVVDAMLFLAGSMSSFRAMRLRSRARAVAWANLGDVAFLAGLMVMVVVCAMVTWALI